MPHSDSMVSYDLSLHIGSPIVASLNSVSQLTLMGPHLYCFAFSYKEQDPGFVVLPCKQTLTFELVCKMSRRQGMCGKKGKWNGLLPGLSFTLLCAPSLDLLLGCLVWVVALLR